jgi:hypothetical protein
MKIDPDPAYRYSHTFDSSYHQKTWRDTLLLASIAIFGVCFFIYGTPFERIEGSLEFVSEYVKGGEPVLETVPGALQTLLALYLVKAAVVLFLIEEARQYWVWRNALVSSGDLQDLEAYTATVDFKEHPYFRFDMPISVMTNADLSAWCKRYNKIAAGLAKTGCDRWRSRRDQRMAARMDGTIAPRKGYFHKASRFARTDLVFTD